MKSPLGQTIDLIPLSLVLFCGAAQWSLYSLVDSAALAFVGAVLLWPLQTRVIHINHNHSHCPIFRPVWLNRLLEIVIFYQIGTQSHGFVLQHCVAHHMHYLDQDHASPDLDSNAWLDAEGRRLSRFRYSVMVLARAYATAKHAGRRHPRLWRGWQIMAPLLAAGLVALLVLRPGHAIAVFVVPIAAHLFAQAWGTYVHHVGLGISDPYSASYTNEDRNDNLLTFNHGYHLAHHIRPGLHWSKLPELHETFRERVPAHCYYDGEVPAELDERFPVGARLVDAARLD